MYNDLHKKEIHHKFGMTMDCFTPFAMTASRPKQSIYSMNFVVLPRITILEQF
jgi:hypothetical protein